jgi:isocitrate dehydrogenase
VNWGKVALMAIVTPDPKSTIWYTYTDEAPALALLSLLPILRSYAAHAGVFFQTKDISLAGRILAAFSDTFPVEQKVEDALATLGQMVKEPQANIIKLPNISASIPQLEAAILELRRAGYQLPSFPHEPTTDEEREIAARYRRVLGSAVNPVLRQGNSDRRAPASVKQFAQHHPHRMGPWSATSKTNVACMEEGDFRHSEESVTVSEPGALNIEFVSANGAARPLREPVPVLAGEIVDVAVMRARALQVFLKAQVKRAREESILFSLHLKATMMKVSDPIIFGHGVRAFFPSTFARYGDRLHVLGLSAENGLGSIFAGLESAPDGDEIRASFDQEMLDGPALAMVDSARGISNLHVPSDVIVDASMPAMIRTSGHMWGPDGQESDVLAVIPDSSYADIYQVVIDDCRQHGAFDPATMGSVSNVGLMAQAAEEYGSHDKTFELDEAGTVRVTDASGTVYFAVAVEAGDIFRMCQTKDVAIRDWVGVAVERARASGEPAIFWLDRERAHDAQVIAKVEHYLGDFDTEGLDLSILAPTDATKRSIERIRRGENTISVTGNVLRDYLTDLFPIMELGTSAKMLSIVRLLAGGGLFETGAGGSAPKHVQQLVEENYLRWDSLGEFLAVAVSLEFLAAQTMNPRAKVLAETLDGATAMLLNNDRSPSRAVGGLDNRGSHFYLALYWAQELARQSDDASLATAFSSLARALEDEEEKIVGELLAVQGQPADIGGYYRPHVEKATNVMRPSSTFNTLIDGFSLFR